MNEERVRVGILAVLAAFAMAVCFQAGRHYEKGRQLVLVPVLIKSSDGTASAQVQQLVTLAEAQALEDQSAAAQRQQMQAQHEQALFEQGKAIGAAEAAAAKGKK